MKDKKLYIGLIVFMVALFLIIFFLFGRNSLKENKRSITLLVGDNTIWTYQNRRWQSVDSYDSYNWQTYRTYLDGEFFGEYSLWHDDRWYAFDEDKNAISLDGNFFAYSSNNPIDVVKLMEEEVVDKTYVQYVLKDNDLDVDSEFTTLYQYSFDFDGDGEVEKFYVMSNVFAMEFSPDVEFSIVFMVKSGKIYYLYKEIYNGAFNGCKPYFSGFLDYNEDNSYEFLLSCGRYSVEEEINTFYQFDKNGFKILISNQN